MSESFNNIESKLEKLGKIDENQERRRSFFQNPNQTTAEKKKNCAFEDEWNRRWGHHNLDYVNVIEYPKEYVEQLKKDRETRLASLKKMCESSRSVQEEASSSTLVVTEDMLNAEQKRLLQIIDSKINKYVKDATALINKMEVIKKTENVVFEKHENGAKHVENVNL
ncbi:uncharacterized protein LOC115883199 [Sitophilus oryzae]|uniref:Uncharacterized protein LOC115883199 n=1 Tax=Sitophilus oryzae TaxID=7048 RepID=A0A6J2Y302_SITOR|nr:uncharacterized protein LOC115883199 [Sitophilus oryzae]